LSDAVARSTDQNYPPPPMPVVFIKLDLREMRRTTLVVSALATALSMSMTDGVQAAGDVEKCYGIAKAGKTDCQTATHSCAGTSTKDADPSSWIAVPAGTCERIMGGSLKPKA
jgi:uncharacterized membrane protein